MSSSLEGMLGDLLGGNSKGGLGDLLGGGGGKGGALTALIPVVTGMLASGGLEKLLGGMRSAGLDDKAKSWVASGDNKPISPDEVKQVVGQGQIDEVAKQAGVSQAEACGLIAKALPAVVNAVTPDGQVPDAATLDKNLSKVQAAVG